MQKVQDSFFFCFTHSMLSSAKRIEKGTCIKELNTCRNGSDRKLSEESERDKLHGRCSGYFNQIQPNVLPGQSVLSSHNYNRIL